MRDGRDVVLVSIVVQDFGYVRELIAFGIVELVVFVLDDYDVKVTVGVYDERDKRVDFEQSEEGQRLLNAAVEIGLKVRLVVRLIVQKDKIEDSVTAEVTEKGRGIAEIVRVYVGSQR